MEITERRLKHFDGNYEKLLFFSQHATLYEMKKSEHDEEVNWQKMGIDGPFYIIQRNRSPDFRIIVFNRQDDSIFDTFISSPNESHPFKFEESRDEFRFILFHNEGRDRAFWLHDKKDNEKLVDIFKKITNNQIEKIRHEESDDESEDDEMMEANGFSDHDSPRAPHSMNQTIPTSFLHNSSNRILVPGPNLLTRQNMIPPQSLLQVRGMSPIPHPIPMPPPPQPPSSLHNSSNHLPFPPLQNSSNQIPPPQMQSTPNQNVPTQMDMKNLNFSPLYFPQTNIPYSNGTSTSQDSNMKVTPNPQPPQPMYGYPPSGFAFPPNPYYFPPQNMLLNPNLFRNQSEGGEITFPTGRLQENNSSDENVNTESKGNVSSQIKDNKKNSKQKNKRETKKSQFSIEDFFIDDSENNSSSFNKRIDTPVKSNSKQMIPKKKQEYNHKKDRYQEEDYDNELNFESDKDLLREILNELRNRKQPSITKRQLKYVLEELLNDDIFIDQLYERIIAKRF